MQQFINIQQHLGQYFAYLLFIIDNQDCFCPSTGTSLTPTGAASPSTLSGR